MVMEPPSPQCVGREFVRQYYTLLNQAPLHLHRFVQLTDLPYFGFPWICFIWGSHGYVFDVGLMALFKLSFHGLFSWVLVDLINLGSHGFIYFGFSWMDLSKLGSH